MMKNIASILLTAALLATMFSVFAVPAMAEDPYSGLDGNGTESAPYQIQNNADWDHFTSAVKSDPTHGKQMYFQLTNDIGSEGNEVWTYVIGEFNGIFDGAGKTIWYDESISLFSNNNGEINNLVVRSSDATYWLGGGVICYANHGVIDRCVNYIPLAGGTNVSGICGINDGLIVNCMNYAPISSATGYIGGICSNNGGRILNCINTAPVSGSGICGEHINTADVRIELCFNCGLPSSGYSICQFHYETQNVTLHNCFSMSEIDGQRVTISNDDANNIGNPCDSLLTTESIIDRMNHHIDSYDTISGHKLFRWKLGNDGLPTYEKSLTGSTLSNGDIWIIVAVAAASIGGVAEVIITKKKAKNAAEKRTAS